MKGLEVQKIAKRKKKYLKFSAIGGTTSVQFGNEWVEILIRIPRKKLTERLVGKNGRHLKRLGINMGSFSK